MRSLGIMIIANYTPIVINPYIFLQFDATFHVKNDYIVELWKIARTPEMFF